MNIDESELENVSKNLKINSELIQKTCKEGITGKIEKISV